MLQYITIFYLPFCQEVEILLCIQTLPALLCSLLKYFCYVLPERPTCQIKGRGDEALPEYSGRATSEMYHNMN